jgi:hypothetical protein
MIGICKIEATYYYQCMHSVQMTNNAMVGTITISVELELGWGMHEKDQFSHLSEDRASETRTLQRLLDIADEYEHQITFPVVGHLLHDSCSGHHEGPYPDDWWSEDPGTDEQTDPLFYAPELVREIQNRPVEHEITTHTYSHILADKHPGELLRNELSKVEDVYSKFGIPTPTSIVMPRHQQPDYSILADHGIETIRRPIDEYKPSIGDPVSKAWWFWNRSHPTSSLQTQDGLLETTVTPHPSLTSVTLPTGRSSPHPVFSVIPKHLRRERHRRYLVNAIDRAVEGDSHVHLWTHVYNLANEDQWAPVGAALSHLGDRQDKGQVLIRCMKDLGVTNRLRTVDE